MKAETKLGTCSSCGAEILWAKTPAGRAMPLERRVGRQGEEIDRLRGGSHTSGGEP